MSPFAKKSAIVVAAALLGGLSGLWLRARSPAPPVAEAAGDAPAERPRVAPASLLDTRPAPGLRAADGGRGHQDRSPDEWQGMLVKLDDQPPCDTSARCGMAAACVDGRCGACVRDDECAAGEACVLDHCVVATRAECRSRRDCAADALCVLSGYSTDLRGNGDMRAQCLSASGGTEPERGPPVERKTIPAAPRPVSADALLEELAE